MKMKKIVGFGIASVMALTMAMGFTAAAADYEECTLKFAWWGGDSRHEVTQQAVNAFMEKYPGINVEVNFGAWSDWESARALEFQSGTAADVNQINLSWIDEFDSNGDVFLDLNTVSDTLDLTQWDEAYLDMMKDQTGQLAGVPVSMTGRVFYWDKTTFDEAGLEVPTSLAELREAGKVFQEKLGDDYYPLALGEFDRMILMTFYLQAKYEKPILADGTVNMTVEELQDGLDFIMSLEADHVIAVHTMFGAGALDPGQDSGLPGKVLDRVIEELHQAGKKITFISAQLPYDAARFQEADAILLCFGSTPMREIPDKTDAVSLNIPAAISAAFGEFEPSGKLPVSIYSLDDSYSFTEEVLYPRA